MENDDPFADIDSATPKSKKSENSALLRDARKKAKLELNQEIDDLELDLISKPANPIVLIAAIAIFAGALIFGMKPVSFTETGQGVYAVQVDIALIDDDLVTSECRPVGKNKALENSTVVLSGIPGVSDISLTEKLPFAEANVVGGTACYFELLFPGVLPFDGTTFKVEVILPNKTSESEYKLDPQMKIGPIEFTLD